MRTSSLLNSAPCFAANSAATRWGRWHLAFVLSTMLFVALPLTRANAADVLLTRNDHYQTGANLQETLLNVANVKPSRFGRLFAYPVEGNIFAQPLLVSNVNTPLGPRNVVYVATTDNFLYAFDAESNAVSGGLIWSRRFGRRWVSAELPERLAVIPYGTALSIPVPIGASQLGSPIPRDDPVHFQGGSTTFLGNVGIVSTPVIDRSRNTIYLIVRTKEGAEYVQTLHALDISTGSERLHSPREIARDTSPVGFAALQNQRAGLALVHNRLIAAWGSPGGREGNRIGVGSQNATFHGYVMAFDADTLQLSGCFTTGSQGVGSSPDTGRSGAGIWQSGRAPAIDSDDFVYFFTGNGWNEAPKASNRCEGLVQPASGTPPSPFPAPSRDLANSLIKLDASSMKLVEALIDPEHEELDHCDMDLGGSGPLIVPDTSLIIGGGKRGFLKVIGKRPDGQHEFLQSVKIYEGPAEHLHLDFSNLIIGGGTQGTFYVVKNPDLGVRTDPNDPSRTYDCATQGLHHVMGGPAYWRSESLGLIIYISIENDLIRAFKIDETTRRLGAVPFSISSMEIAKHPAAILSLSADGHRSGSGILWAIHTDLSHDVLRMHFPDEGHVISSKITGTEDPVRNKVRGILQAFDAEDLSHELWNSDMMPDDAFGNFAKFTPVTVANGKVYVPTFSGQLVVFGLRGR